MNEFIYAFGPAIGKAFLAHFLGPLPAQAGETALRLAAQRFKDAGSVRAATQAAETLGKTVAVKIETALRSEGATNEELATVGRELAFVMSSVDIATKAVAARLNVDRLARDLKKLPLPVGLSEREENFLLMALAHCAVDLHKLAPASSNYEVIRDEVLLNQIDTIAVSAGDIITGQANINEIIMSVDKRLDNIEDFRKREVEEYEQKYVSRIWQLLDYVEILGIDDIARDNRESSLDVAYLSLSVTGSDALPSDFSTLLLTLNLTNGRLIIQGGAGSGKSTLLRWAAVNSQNLTDAVYPSLNARKFGNNWKKVIPNGLQLISPVWSKYIRAGFHRSKKDEMNPHEMRKRNSIVLSSGFLRADHAATHSEFSSLTTKNKYNTDDMHFINKMPFLVRLRDLDDKLPGIDELSCVLSPVMPLPPLGWAEECLSSGRAILLFDGVDEIPDGARRRGILGQIAEFSRAYPRATIIVTTRPHAFDPKESGLDDFRIVTVDDLSANQQERFIDNWHRARAGKTSEKGGRFDQLAAELKERFINSPVLARLATNPLLCAAICALHEHDPETLPEDERTLCAELTRMLAYKRDLASGRSRPISVEQFGAEYQMSYEKKKALLARLAAEMVRSGASHLKMRDTERLLASTLRETAQHELDPRDVCRALVSRSGVLRGASHQFETAHEEDVGPRELLPEAVEFVHNRFKEWLASTYFLSHGTTGELVQHADEEGYEQACVFAAAAPDNQTFVSTLITSLLERAEEITGRDTKRRLHILTVRCALVAQTLPDETRSKTDALGKRLLPPKSMEEAKALADLGELAIDKLRFKASRSAREASHCIRCLSIINTPRAHVALAEYRVETRWTVVEELSRHIDPIKIPIVVRALAEPSLHPDSLLRLKKRILSIPLDVFPADTKFLNLSGTGISDIRFLSSLSSLKQLSLSYSPVRDISPLNDTSLETLILDYTLVEDVTSLSGQSNIRFLSLAGTAVRDIAALGQLKELKTLMLTGSKVKDIGPISELSSLGILNLAETEVEDITPLKNITSIKNLNLTKTNITNGETLASLVNLVVLNVDYTKIRDIGFVDTLGELGVITLRGLEVSDISALEHCKKLVDVDLAETEITSIRALEKLDKLVSVCLHSTEVEDLSPLSGLSSLANLYLGFTKVKDISPLAGLRKLHRLVIVGTNVEDLSPLFDNTDLFILTPAEEWTTVTALRQSLGHAAGETIAAKIPASDLPIG